MPNRVLIKRSAVAGKVPTAADLQLGELAINTNDGKLFLKKDNGTASIVEVGAGVSDGDKGDITVSGSGATWTIDANAVTTSKMGGDVTALAKSLLQGSSQAAMLATLGISNASVNLVVFTNSALYVPSANTKAIVVYLTGAGGAGGSSAATTVVGFYGAAGGTGAGTIVFSMPANPSQTFQVSIGPATAVTAATVAQGANGSPSTFGILTAGVLVTNIATAPGGVGGLSSGTAGGASVPSTPATIAAANASYVAANAQLGIRGSAGSSAIGSYVSTTANLGGANNGAGGGSLWGAGAAPSFTRSGAINGSNGIAYGSGGSGAAKLMKVTTSTSATGGAGAQGVCMILEIKG